MLYDNKLLQFSGCDVEEQKRAGDRLKELKGLLFTYIWIPGPSPSCDSICQSKILTLVMKHFLCYSLNKSHLSNSFRSEVFFLKILRIWSWRRSRLTERICTCMYLFGHQTVGWTKLTQQVLQTHSNILITNRVEMTTEANSCAVKRRLVLNLDYEQLGPVSNSPPANLN